MAREAMITRAIVGSKVTCMVVELETAEVKTEVFELAHYIADPEKVEKAIENIVPEGVKLVQVQSIEKTEKLLGITEADFLKYAVALDPKTRKRI